MKRLAFNGGEISPSMALRCDMDPFPRSCSKLLNWELSPTGGITRRRGMQVFTSALEGPSRLIPFVYSSDLTYIVEVSEDTIRVLDQNSSEVATFTSVEDSDWGYEDLRLLTYIQLNSILLLVSQESPVMQLKINADYSWTLEPYKFKNPPWHSISARDHEITITSVGSYYQAEFSEEEKEDETSGDAGDTLRVSYYTKRQEAFASGASLRSGRWTKYTQESGGITASTTFAVGDKIALATEPTYELFICTHKFNGSEDFTAGCTSPANYMGGDAPRFMRADDATGFDSVTPIDGLTAASVIEKGAKVKLRSGYWKLYTCVRAFATTDHVGGKTSPEDYPSHFMAGVSISEDALTCRGTWKFHCSGTWYGTYEIRRSYTTGALTDQWETLGESISTIGTPSNNIITGNEEEEECYMRLCLTSVRHIGDDLAAGWPPDDCGNKLVVSAYKHDMHLAMMADGYFRDTTVVKRPLTSTLTTDDWSWCAFNARYGYPCLAVLHESRLVFASTGLQPQTIWMSRTDDINNFATGATDNAALLLTMSTQTQAAICWMVSRGNSIQLGTEDGEWVLQSTSGSGITPNTARIVNHGRIGSAHIPATSAADRLLYCERGAGRVYQFAYDYSQDAFTSQDLTIFADHMLSQGGGVREGTITRKPFCAALYALEDGTMAVMSYNSHHNVHAWHRWETKGTVESVCALPNGNNPDNVYLIVQRADGRYIERLSETEHVDNGENDYVSLMETTAFTVPDADEEKRHLCEVRFYLTEPVPAESVEVRTACTVYNKVAYTGMIPEGWNTFCSISGWNDRPLVGIRVTGDTPCTILAAQA